MSDNTIGSALHQLERAEEDLRAAVTHVAHAVGAATRDGLLVSRIEALEVALAAVFTEHRKVLEKLVSEREGSA